MKQDKIILSNEINDAIYSYLYEIKINMKSENTINSYKNDLLDFSNYLETIKKVNTIEDINKEDIKRYLNVLVRRRLSSASRSRKTTSLRNFFKYMYDEKLISTNIFAGIKNPRKDKTLPEEILSVEDVLKLLKSVDVEKKYGKRNLALIEIIYGSGLRVSELLNIKLTDLHLNENYIRILGKGLKERKAIVSSYAVQAILKYLRNERDNIIDKTSSSYKENFLFINNQGTSLSRQGFYKILKEMCKSAAISSTCHPHTLRHSLATHLVENNMDLRFVKEVLGHKDISTTQIYMHLSSAKKKDDYLNTFPRAKKNIE